MFGIGLCGCFSEYNVSIWYLFGRPQSHEILWTIAGKGGLSFEQVVAGDFEQGKASMLLLLKLKTNYFEKLPWLFCALAHSDETIARNFASKIRLAWAADPRPEAHHRITADLMQAGIFRESLDRFIDGASRVELPAEFRIKVAEFRFVPVVETTVEAKHARTSLARKAS